MANPELGAKQICPTCASKFYDLNRRPAHCPKCGADFDPEEALKTRVRSRARVPAPDYEETEEAPAKPRDEEAEELEEADDTPEIDQAVEADPVDSDDDDADPDAAPAPAEDLGVDFEEDPELAATEDDEDVPFIEDEDDDDFPDDDLGLPEEGADEEH